MVEVLWSRKWKAFANFAKEIGTKYASPEIFCFPKAEHFAKLAEVSRYYARAIRPKFEYISRFFSVLHKCKVYTLKMCCGYVSTSS